MAKRDRQQGGRLPVDVFASTFFGTLRSELDEPNRLPEVMEEVLAKFTDLHQRYDAGDLSDEDFGLALKELVFTDEAGDQWSIGASSSRWYRKRGVGRWIPTPPDLAALAR